MDETTQQGGGVPPAGAAAAAAVTGPPVAAGEAPADWASATALGALQKKLDQVIAENARYREQLRSLTTGVQQALGIEPAAEQPNQPWEARIQAVQQQVSKAVEERVGQLQTRLDAAEQAKQAAELQATKLRIGGQYGLPELMALRLQGETEEALRKDAEALRATLPKQAQVSMTNPAGNTEQDQVTALAQSLYDRRRPLGGLTVFDRP